MEKAEIFADIANIHNQLVQISVHGDDAIAMANVIVGLRNLANNLQSDVEAEKQNGASNQGEQGLETME